MKSLASKILTGLSLGSLVGRSSFAGDGVSSILILEGSSAGSFVIVGFFCLGLVLFERFSEIFDASIASLSL
jgi:hypothetical protein